jgi:hypothetical protein
MSVDGKRIKDGLKRDLYELKSNFKTDVKLQLTFEDQKICIIQGVPRRINQTSGTRASCYLEQRSLINFS